MFFNNMQKCIRDIKKLVLISASLAVCNLVKWSCGLATLALLPKFDFPQPQPSVCLLVFAIMPTYIIFIKHGNLLATN